MSIQNNELLRSGLRSVLLAGTFGFGLVIVMPAHEQQREYRLLCKQVGAAADHVKKLQQSVSQVEQQLAAMADDDFLYEQVAREELLLGKRGEIVYMHVG